MPGFIDFGEFGLVVCDFGSGLRVWFDTRQVN